MRTLDTDEDNISLTNLFETVISFIVMLVFVSFIPNVYICFSIFILSFALYRVIPAPYNMIMCMAGFWFFLVFVMAWQEIKDPPFYAHIEWNKRIKFEHVYNKLHSEARRLIVSWFEDKEKKE